MRMLFISQLFDPEYSIKGLEFLRDVKASGIEVDVITTFPNYPTGKIFPGYKLRACQIEEKDEMRIFRVWSYISHSRSRFARGLAYVTFMLSALGVSLFIRKPDVVYAYHPQITTGIIGIILKKTKSVKFITDVQDLWPDALAATGNRKDSILYRLIYRICSYIYKQADAIIVLSKGYKRELVKRGVDEQKISIVYNWHAEEQETTHIPITQVEGSSLLKGQSKYKFVYAGNLGAAQSLKTIIHAFDKCKEYSIDLNIIGSGVEATLLAEYTKNIGAENIYFLGYIPSKEIGPYLMQADVLVAHLKDDPLFKITIPSKVQAYLSLSKPILMAVGGEANQIIEDAHAGICAEPDDVESITRGIKDLIRLHDEWPIMSKNGYSFYYTSMSRSFALNKILKILRNI
ncbi:glycosyltransferase family 4 protein [Castellaniella sp. FW104-16D08]|uniref:glycosyltransferase family 4 protein n=1 Tax=unclassified Castellaniella TaxID=2617606 RepID=UPI0033160C8F